jgi:NADPH-dependent 7-cyano-7-deazaguanine reductase QueF
MWKDLTRALLENDIPQDDTGFKELRIEHLHNRMTKTYEASKKKMEDVYACEATCRCLMTDKPNSSMTMMV